MGEEEVLEESGASDGGPVGAAIPGRWRAGWAESVRHIASLDGVRTGGEVTSVGDCGEKKGILLIEDILIIQNILCYCYLFAGFH